jgi:hypothetical protein
MIVVAFMRSKILDFAGQLVQRVGNAAQGFGRRGAVPAQFHSLRVDKNLFRALAQLPLRSILGVAPEPVGSGATPKIDRKIPV